MDFLSTIFALIGIVLAIINYELDLRNDEIDKFDIENLVRKIDSGKITAMDMPRFTDSYTKKMRWIIFATSMLSLLCLIHRHILKINWINLYFNKAFLKEN